MLFIVLLASVNTISVASNNTTDNITSAIDSIDGSISVSNDVKVIGGIMKILY